MSRENRLICLSEEVNRYVMHVSKESWKCCVSKALSCSIGKFFELSY